ncbi:MAG: shikimate dehydrogenase [Dethiobacteria bacterium]
MMMIDGRTKIVGLFGAPVSHSLSPAMHNAAFHKFGLNYCYLPFHVETNNLPSAVKAIRALGIRGVNITAPHKEKTVLYLDTLSETARLLQAVNTVINDDGKLYGENTDVDGFIFLLRNNLKNKGEGEKALMLGAGGAAKATALALVRSGVKSLTIANRTLAKAEQLSNLLKSSGELKGQRVETVLLDKKNLQEHLKTATLVVNALSCDPLELDLLPPGGLAGPASVIDLRYSPAETPFLHGAKAAGCRSINGLDMLLGQGARAFELFTGLKKAPLKVMKDALLKFMEHRA